MARIHLPPAEIAMPVVGATRVPRKDTVTAEWGTLPAMAETTWTSETVPLASGPVHVMRSGSGTPVLVLHHDTGSPERLPFYDALAARHTVLVPSHPGYDKSERPAWMRNVRDISVVYQALIAEKGLAGVTLVGLGFGGWIAAEMATMTTRALS